MIFNPGGSEAISPRQLGTELGSNALGAFLLAVVLAWTGASRIQAAAIGLLMGVFAWVSIDVSYWNWYKFPGAFTRSALMEQSVGWMLGGLVIGLVLGRRRSAAPASNQST